MDSPQQTDNDTNMEIPGLKEESLADSVGKDINPDTMKETELTMQMEVEPDKDKNSSETSNISSSCNEAFDTAAENYSTSGAHNESETISDTSSKQESDQLNSARVKMLARVAVSEAHFKHQQRGEPDLTLQEKIEIAQVVLDTNKVSFLSRFGKYLELEDLTYFSDHRNVYEIDFFCKQVEKSNSKDFNKNRIKNRRYQAMKELISQNEYFSDEEMKYRDPYLYDQMVGQYLTDDEIQAGIDKSDLRFSTILVKHIDQLNENERFNRDKDKEECQQEEEEDSDEEELEESEGQQKSENHEKTTEKISEHQKQELRAEFLSIMQERFLQGEDSNFNYSQVDNNEEYDDLTVLSYDAEEKYFDDEDPESIHSDSNL